MIRVLGLICLITILCSTQIISIYGTITSYPDLVWVDPLHLKAPASIQILTWELMSDTEILVTIPEENSTSTQSNPYEIHNNPTNITVVMFEAPLEYHVTLTAKRNQEIGHPIKIVISGGGEVNQTTIAHIIKDKIKIQFFIITVEDRPSTLHNIIYSFIIGLSIGAAIVAINLLIFRKRYRTKSSLTDNSYSLITF
ncbi:hypothetical protein [[Eubacterium] cellulosolvens]